MGNVCLSSERTQNKHDVLVKIGYQNHDTKFIISDDQIIRLGQDLQKYRHINARAILCEMWKTPDEFPKFMVAYMDCFDKLLKCIGLDKNNYQTADEVYSDIIKILYGSETNN